MVSKKLTMCSAIFFEYLGHMLHRLFAEVAHYEMHISQQHGYYKLFFNSPSFNRKKELYIYHRIHFDIHLFHKASQDGADRHAKQQLASLVWALIMVKQSMATESKDFDRSIGPSLAIVESSLAMVGSLQAAIKSLLATAIPSSVVDIRPWATAS